MYTLYVAVIMQIVELRESGLRYKQIDELLGLENQTPWSAYRLMKRITAKRIANEM